MKDILIVLLAILPGILLSVWIYFQDRYEREDKWMVILVFLAGALSTFLALGAESFIITEKLESAQDVWSILYLSFVGVALPEELAKFLIFIVFPFQLKHFNEKIDGIVYYVLVAMGFATVENFFYIEYVDSNWNILLRAFTAVPAHASFAVIAGYFAGLAKFTPDKSVMLLAKGFLLAVLIHGIYDFFILMPQIENLGIFAIITLIICLRYAFKFIKLHLKNSRFASKKNTNPFM